MVVSLNRGTPIWTPPKYYSPSTLGGVSNWQTRTVVNLDTLSRVIAVFVQ